MPKDEKIDEY